MRVMESMTGRIGQLESSTWRLEQKVQRGVQGLRNKQEVMEAPSNIE